MYNEGDKKRLFEDSSQSLEPESYRTEWRRDIARLLHSPSFRRLQGKTQLFPTQESDFFRNRLTHSLEVAQIAKSIAIRLNNTSLKDTKYKIEEDICEFAGLAHDLGHPPFGHQGEDALDECMRDYGGFEGNAQTLRILTKLEKKVEGGDYYKKRFGLNLTTRSLASILKYDRCIQLENENRPEEWRNKAMKGYYSLEKDIVEKLKKNIAPDRKKTGTFKTVECQIMDIADDIAYSTYDLEEVLKLHFLNR